MGTWHKRRILVFAYDDDPYENAQSLDFLRASLSQLSVAAGLQLRLPWALHVSFRLPLALHGSSD